MKLFKPPEFRKDLSRMFPNTNDFLNEMKKLNETLYLAVILSNHFYCPMALDRS